MKRSLLALVVTALALGSLTSAKAAVETYNIDPVHTWVGFSVAHFFTKVPGYSRRMFQQNHRRLPEIRSRV